jgi:hypothetical protein
MKNFIEHLSEAQKTYDFRIKVANFDPKDSMDRLENALNAYGLESITKPKTLPIQENAIDFPSMGPTEIYVIDAVLKYPVNDQQLGAIIAERAGFPLNSVRVIPRNHPEELWRNNEGELREFVQGEAVLDKPYEDSAEGKALGKMYAEKGVLLKELSKVQWEIAGKDNTIGGGSNASTGKTLNDIPQGITDPVGSNQNKIPSPVKGN